MLGGAFLKLGSTTFLFCFLLPLILSLLIVKEAELDDDEDRSFLEKLASWWKQQEENRRKWIRTKANIVAKTLHLVIFMMN